MSIYHAGIVGSPSIGVYSLCTDKMVIIPKCVPLKKAERFSEWLNVDLIHTTVGGSVLVGALVSANSNGMLLPHYARDVEVEAIREVFDGNVGVMKTEETAYGNMVLSNDSGAIVDPRLKASEIKKVSQILDVRTVKGEIAGLPYVGSLAVATNIGVLAHPLLQDSELNLLKEVLKVTVNVGSINCGIPYVGTGLIANSHSAVAGLMTTGPEMFILGQAFRVVDEDE